MTTASRGTTRRGLLLLGLAALPVLAAGACSAEDAASASGTSATDVEATPVDPGTVIDVRSPEEYAAGHLEGAINIDVEGTTFAQEVDKLDRGATYTVYCRSGNRSAQARSRMEDLGFTDVHDAGGLQEAADALGLPVVSD